MAAQRGDRNGPDSIVTMMAGVLRPPPERQPPSLSPGSQPDGSAQEGQSQSQDPVHARRKNGLEAVPGVSARGRSSPAARRSEANLGSPLEAETEQAGVCLRARRALETPSSRAPNPTSWRSGMAPLVRSSGSLARLTRVRLRPPGLRRMAALIAAGWRGSVRGQTFCSSQGAKPDRGPAMPLPLRG